jgi:hypothetical protein
MKPMFLKKKNVKKTAPKGVMIYQAKSGAIELREDLQNETLWATQAQVAEIFNIERSVVTKHIRNILQDRELDEKSVCAKFAHTADDDKVYQVQFYNLDVILSVGYRANSARAIEFRQWATNTLRGYILDGYAINQKRVANNYEKFLDAVRRVRELLPVASTMSGTRALFPAS